MQSGVLYYQHKEETIMSVKDALRVRNTAEIRDRKVHNGVITLSANGISISVPLKKWNRYSLNAWGVVV